MPIAAAAAEPLEGPPWHYRSSLLHQRLEDIISLLFRVKIASIGRIIDVGETIEWDDVGEWDVVVGEQQFIEGKV